MSSSILQKYRTEILDLAMRHGARDVRVFGSLARGEGTEGSNLDLLVTLEEGRSLLDLVGLKQDLEDLVHHPVNVVTEKALSPYLREHVLSEVVPLERFVTEAFQAHMEQQTAGASAGGWKSVFGQARREEVEPVDAVIGEELERIEPDEWW